MLFDGELDGGPGRDGMVYFDEASIEAYLDRHGYGGWPILLPGLLPGATKRAATQGYGTTRPIREIPAQRYRKGLGGTGDPLRLAGTGAARSRSTSDLRPSAVTVASVSVQ
jgi:hypothetical protein